MLLGQSHIEIPVIPVPDNSGFTADASSLVLPMLLVFSVLAIFAWEYYREWRMSRRFRRFIEN